MSPQQEDHLNSIRSHFNRLLDYKYRKGQLEHGGDLHTRNCLSEAIDEAVDLVTYLITEQEKKAEAKCIVISVLANLTGDEVEAEKVKLLRVIDLLQ